MKMVRGKMLKLHQFVQQLNFKRKTIVKYTLVHIIQVQRIAFGFVYAIFIVSCICCNILFVCVCVDAIFRIFGVTLPSLLRRLSFFHVLKMK